MSWTNQGCPPIGDFNKVNSVSSSGYRNRDSTQERNRRSALTFGHLLGYRGQQNQNKAPEPETLTFYKDGATGQQDKVVLHHKSPKQAQVTNQPDPGPKAPTQVLSVSQAPPELVPTFQGPQQLVPAFEGPQQFAPVFQDPIKLVPAFQDLPSLRPGFQGPSQLVPGFQGPKENALKPQARRQPARRVQAPDLDAAVASLLRQESGADSKPEERASDPGMLREVGLRMLEQFQQAPFCPIPPPQAYTQLIQQQQQIFQQSMMMAYGLQNSGVPRFPYMQAPVQGTPFPQQTQGSMGTDFHLQKRIKEEKLEVEEDQKRCFRPDQPPTLTYYHSSSNENGWSPTSTSSSSGRDEPGKLSPYRIRLPLPLTSPLVVPNSPLSPRSSKKPTPEAEKDPKYYERRRRNNLAAKKSRDARKAREYQVQLRLDHLEKENEVLKAQVNLLRDESNMLQLLYVQRKEEEGQPRNDPTRAGPPGFYHPFPPQFPK